LIIADHRVKPAVVMKALFGTFAVVVSAGIAIVAVLSCHTQLTSAKRPEYRFGDPDAHPRKYVELKNGINDEGTFRAALRTLKKNEGDCQIYFLRQPKEKEEFNYCDAINVSLKTDNVIKSVVANSVRPEESTGNDPHATYRVASPNGADIEVIKELLKPH
jgi:hypothetical protein